MSPLLADAAEQRGRERLAPWALTVFFMLAQDALCDRRREKSTDR
jgi:hypothetical protein